MRELARLSGKRIAGLLGPASQVCEARRVLGLDESPATMDSREGLFALDLDDLRTPPALQDGAVRCRRSTPADLPMLTAWRVDYCVEALGQTAGDKLRARCREDIEQTHEDGRLWLLHDDEDQPVASAAFNAALPDTVQIGGVWTPPELRCRGHARAVVAGALLSAREKGVRRAILFTDETNWPARRAYEAIGFDLVGDFGLVLLAHPAKPRL